MKLTDSDNDKKWDEREEEREGILQKAVTTRVLLGIIAVLLIFILVLLTIVVSSRKNRQEETDSDLQQTITDYAKEQQEMEEQVLSEEEKKPAVEQTVPEETEEEEEEESEPEEEEEPVSADNEKTAIVVDVEDENDEAYTKEFILKEAYPYFADNKQDAIWDLAHLKRYVKLSKGLEGTGDYYYQGDVDGEGKPHGKGLAIYEKNSYYFGDWSHGVRSGKGTWFRFYINQKNKNNAMGVYMSHIYSGDWADNLPNGEGAEHYDVDISKLTSTKGRMLQNVVGPFKNGLYNGDMYANTVDYIGTVQEWDGIAQEGVFTLWRDMSAIGECSVWRNKDDHSLCLDIDKSENKNQGIRELLK
ncbi:MAG: lipase chaperone [Lachnospiraceae bacterium]|jgi:hypothetical protein|nr:lipase chaperone [Lachnospiraceae bacterium]